MSFNVSLLLQHQSDIMTYPGPLIGQWPSVLPSDWLMRRSGHRYQDLNMTQASGRHIFCFRGFRACLRSITAYFQRQLSVSGERGRVTYSGQYTWGQCCVLWIHVGDWNSYYISESPITFDDGLVSARMRLKPKQISYDAWSEPR